MDKKKYAEQHHVAYKSFPGKNLFAVSAKIERVNSGERSVYVDVVFLEFTEDFAGGGKDKSVMKVTAHDLRSMSYGIRELLKNGKSSYKKWTDPSMTGIDRSKNELSLAILEAKEGKPPVYYINLSAGNKKIGCGFDTYSMVSLSDALLLIAEETDKAMFYFQRQ